MITIDVLTGKVYLFTATENSGGGVISGTTYPQVNLFSDLPTPLASSGKVYIVRTGTGTYPIDRKDSGLYFSNGSNWEHLGDFPEYFKSNNFKIYDDMDASKTIEFDVSDIASGLNPILKIIGSGGTISYLTDLNTKVDLNVFNDYTGNTNNLFLDKNIFNNHTGDTTIHFPFSDVTNAINSAITGNTNTISSWSGLTGQPTNNQDLVDYVTGQTPTLIWGNLVGNIDNQADLQQILNSKSNSGHTHTQYLTSVTWNDVGNKPSLATQADFTAHTNNNNIHYEQSGISITQNQITDFPTLFTGHTFTASGGTKLAINGNEITIYSSTGGTELNGSMLIDDVIIFKSINNDISVDLLTIPYNLGGKSLIISVDDGLHESGLTFNNFYNGNIIIEAENIDETTGTTRTSIFMFGGSNQQILFSECDVDVTINGFEFTTVSGGQAVLITSNGGRCRLLTTNNYFNFSNCTQKSYLAYGSIDAESDGDTFNGSVNAETHYVGLSGGRSDKLGGKAICVGAKLNNINFTSFADGKGIAGIVRSSGVFENVINVGCDVINLQSTQNITNIPSIIFDNIININSDAVDFICEFNREGVIYYGVYLSGATIPTFEDINTGTNSIIFDNVNTNGFTTEIENILGLSAETNYNLYFYGVDVLGNLTTKNKLMFLTTEELPIITAPIITTQAAGNITSTTTTLNGNLTSTGGGTITARGFVRSANANPTTADTVISSGGLGTGAFTANLTGLTPEEVFHYRAYATNEIGTSYGADVVVTMEATSSLPALNAPVLSLGTISVTSVTINWTDVNTTPNETSFQVEYERAIAPGYTQGALPPVNTITAVQSDLLSNTNYNIRIRAMGNGTTTGNSPWSNIINLTTLVDSQIPFIGSYAASLMNDTVIITFNEGVYGDSAASTPLTAADFVVADFISSGATAVSIGAITGVGGATLVGGENTFLLPLTWTGTIDGGESFNIAPAANTSIYDAAGNAASTAQNSETISTVVTGSNMFLNSQFVDASLWEVAASFSITGGQLVYDGTSDTYCSMEGTKLTSVMKASTSYTLTFPLVISSGNASIGIADYNESAVYVAQTNYAAGTVTINFTTPSSISDTGITIQGYMASDNPWSITEISLTED